METRIYTERSNARRAARAAGIDPNLIIETEDGFTFTPPAETETNGHGYADPSALKERAGADLDSGKLKADDRIPAFLKVSPERRKEAWAKNPPRAAPTPKHQEVAVAKPKPTKAPKIDKTEIVLAMLKKGATVEALVDKTGWKSHSLRARLSGIAKPKKDGGLGLKIERERTDGVTTYRLA